MKSVDTRWARAGLLLAGLLAAGGCAGHGAATRAPSADGTEVPLDPADRGDVAEPPATGQGETAQALLESGLAAQEAQAPARAVALYAQALATEDSDAVAAVAYPGMARAHEALRDCGSAIRAYDAFLRRFPEHERKGTTLMHVGACQAELAQWQRSADTYLAAHEWLVEHDGLPSAQVEALARRGYALFQLDRFDEAVVALEAADVVYDAAMRDDTERFATYYFVGMARFYRAAVAHRRFRAVKIREGDREMAADFERKLALLTEAQAAYNHTIRAKHVFWVSAAGYQQGTLFEEFYDALMYAPVPEWLTERQREVYYAELKEQLRPVVDKAIWVFEKNLETARKLGYQNQFIEETERQLARLQNILLAGDATLGAPHPHLAPAETRGDPRPAESGAGAAGEGPDVVAAGAPSEAPRGPLPAVERKLFVPAPTPL